MARRRFILLKECMNIKKGAIFEEECDDGTQGFVLLNYENFDKFYKKGEPPIVRKRCIVVNNPEWFEELGVVSVPIKFVPTVKKFIKTLK